MSTKTHRAPKGLGPAGRKFWRELTATYEFADHELAILRAAARTVDRLERLSEAEVDGELLVSHPQKGLTVSPILVEQRMQGQALARLIASLRIPQDDNAASNGSGRGAHRTPKVLSIVRNVGEGQ